MAAITLVYSNLGLLFTAIYLLLIGLQGLLGFSTGVVPSVLAVIAGILLLIGK